VSVLAGTGKNKSPRASWHDFNNITCTAVLPIETLMGKITILFPECTVNVGEMYFPKACKSN